MPNKKTEYTKGLSGLSKEPQHFRARGLKRTNHLEGFHKAGPPDRSQGHRPPRAHSQSTPSPLHPLTPERGSTGLSFRLSPLCVCALIIYHIINSSIVEHFLSIDFVPGTVLGVVNMVCWFPPGTLASGEETRR